MSEPVHLPASPVAVPRLNDLETEPSLFDTLPPGLQDVLFEQVAVLEARLRVKILARHRTDERAPTEPDRAVKIEEAVVLLGMTEDSLPRHWSKLGGYKDDDGHVKFPMTTIQRHIRRGRR